MKTIEIKQKLVEEALDQLKAAQQDRYVGSTQNVINELELVLRQPPVIKSVCTCKNAELEKNSLVPVYCNNCNAYVQTDL